MEEQYVSLFNNLIAQYQPNSLLLSSFMDDFGDDLLRAVAEQNQPIYSGELRSELDLSFSTLSRSLFPAQERVVRAAYELLAIENSPACIINAEMGTGKTMMAIALSKAMHDQGFHRTLVLSPPHLVYKWRREILQTVPNARVWILNGADTLTKLLKFRSMLAKPTVPEYFILGRVRMRMGYHWRAAYLAKQDKYGIPTYHCPSCYGEILDSEGEPYVSEKSFIDAVSKNRLFCKHKNRRYKNDLVTKVCGEPLWTLCRKGNQEFSIYDRVLKAIVSLPTIGVKTAERLVSEFGAETLATILEDNVQAFSNLMNSEGEFVFSDRQAVRLDRALGKMEFTLGDGGYQPTEFIKRYLPKDYFNLLVVDEGHEYKNYGSAQGQSFGVLARCVNKVVALTGTLMGGYADDIFYLLWRLFPEAMIEDGFTYHKGSLGSAAMSFMRQHGVLKDTVRTVTEFEEGAFNSSKGTKSILKTSKAPGFSPLGILRYVLPITVFLKLSELGGVLPSYEEEFRPIELDASQQYYYDQYENILNNKLREALRQRDNTLTGLVLHALLSWADCCFEEQSAFWKSRDVLLCETPSLYQDDEASPKEQDMIDIVLDNLANGRKCLIYSVYSDTKDTTTRLKNLLKLNGVKAAVLKASVKADAREDWVAEKLDQGYQALICNPELVKTGLDLLEFPTIYFMQTGYNVYTLMQAARRSWRIGQTEPVKVYFAGYVGTLQQLCLELMGQKIAVTQSTSGDMPDSGLDILNQAEDSIEVAMAKQIVNNASKSAVIV